MVPRIRWNAVLAGFFVTAVGTLIATPLLERVGWQVTAGPVDMLTMVFLLLGGFVAGRMGRRFEGIQGAVVAVLYIFAIWLTKQVLDEIHIANVSGLKSLGKLDSWGNFGKDFFYFVAGVLGGLWATPFNERERARETALLHTRVPSRRRPTPRPVEATPTDDLPVS
ncbi:MAG: TIGR04086 family membrane protein [Thermomicrobiales bacterium]